MQLVVTKNMETHNSDNMIIHRDFINQTPITKKFLGVRPSVSIETPDDRREIIGPTGRKLIQPNLTSKKRIVDEYPDNYLITDPLPINNPTSKTFQIAKNTDSPMTNDNPTIKKKTGCQKYRFSNDE